MYMFAPHGGPIYWSYSQMAFIAAISGGFQSKSPHSSLELWTDNDMNFTATVFTFTENLHAACVIALSCQFLALLALLAQGAVLGISIILRHPQCGTSPCSQLPRPSSLQQPCRLHPRGVWGRGSAEHLVVSVGWSQSNVQVRCTRIGLAEHWMPQTYLCQTWSCCCYIHALHHG